MVDLGLLCQSSFTFVLVLICHQVGMTMVDQLALNAFVVFFVANQPCLVELRTILLNYVCLLVFTVRSD